MDDLIDFSDNNNQLQIEGPEQLLAIEDDPFADTYTNNSKPKKKKKVKKEDRKATDGEDLIDFNEENRMDDLLLFGNDNGDDTIQLDHDSDEDEEHEDEFGPIEPGQKRIIVSYNDLKFPVNWYEDTPLSDVREMVICACDSIIDSGFELLSPVDGQPVDLKRIETIKGRGEKYTIVKADEKQEYEKLLGDRWRKIVLEVEPLRHIEAQKAIEFMRLGSNLMRHTGSGIPHIRLFQLSDDLKRLIWLSGSKNINESRIDLRKVTNITTGQKTEKFQKYPLPALSHLSFSIHYSVDKKKVDSLDLTCKDELEFDLWVTGIRALSYHFKGYNISKMLLLGHSRVFNEELRNKKIANANMFLVDQNEDVYESKKLVDCLARKPLNANQLNDKILVLGKKLRSMRQRIDDISEDLEHNPTGDGSVGMGYVSLAQKEDKADDQTLQISRMYDLVDKSEKGMEHIKYVLQKYNENKNTLPDDVEGVPKSMKKNPLKYLDSEIWKVEIDIENVNDL